MRNLRAHGPPSAHKNQVIARATPASRLIEDAAAPTAQAQAEAELKARQETDVIADTDVKTASVGSALVVETGRPTTQTSSSTTTTVGSSSTTTLTATTTPEPIASGDNGVAMTAGIALGVLGGLFFIFLIGYLILKSRRKAMKEKRQDEKLSAEEMTDRRASTKTSATAPRLSLRPVTQFLPKFGDGKQNYPDRRASKEAALYLATPGGTSKALPAAPGSKNPFRDSAERPVTPRHGAASYYDDAPVSPVSEASEVGSMVSRDVPSPPGSPKLSTSALVRSTSVRKDKPKALDLTLSSPPRLPAVPPSPTGTEYSMTSMAPGAISGPSKSAAAIEDAGGPAASTVHRVQLDFKPTLDDELGLKAGQLVRLLHEYDDGWVCSPLVAAARMRRDE